MAAIVNIDVPDIQKAIDFYTAAVDVSFERYLDDEVAELSSGPLKIYLLKEAEGTLAVAGTDVERRYARHWTPVHIDFVVANLEESVKKAEQAGARRETGYSTWRGATHVSFSDPFGHGFCLISFEHGTYE
jgi:predicted enzyme related to lactoylglutathione lyase